MYNVHCHDANYIHVSALSQASQTQFITVSLR